MTKIVEQAVQSSFDGECIKSSMTVFDYIHFFGFKLMITNNMIDDYEGRFIMCGEK
jgi:hypothetical protein